MGGGIGKSKMGHDIIGDMQEIVERIKKVVWGLFEVEVELRLTGVPEGQRGDFATNVAFGLGKKVGKGSMEVAKEIVEAIDEKDWSAEVAGAGFVNVTVRDERLKEEFLKFEVAGASERYVGKVVVSEFSDPNPFKVLHVGHLYTSIVGDAISRLVEYAGGEVHRVNFGGDVGLHVAKTIYEVLRLLQPETHSSASADALLARRMLNTARCATPASLNNDVSDLQQGLDETIELLAKCYVAGTRAYEDDESARSRITELNKEIYEIAEKNEREGVMAKIYWAGREASYDYFDEFYKRIGLKFEKYYPESTVVGLGLEAVRKHVPEVYEESDGAVIYRGEKVGLHTRVFINKEGLPTYEAKDVGLVLQKWQDYEFDESIVITAAEQKDYMRVVLASVAEFEPELAERTRHLTHGMVKLPGAVKMSSRLGNFLRAVDVIEMVRGEGVEEAVAIAAIKYAFLKVKMEGDIAFDVRESVNMQGNSGPYLQYALVRGKSILRHFESAVQRISSSSIETLDEWERRLILKLLGWRAVMGEAVTELAPQKVCTYLYELAQEFSRFYENDKVVGSENEGLRRELVERYVEVLEGGMGVLGVEAVERM